MRGRAPETNPASPCLCACILISPPLLFSFKWRHSPHLDLALSQLTLTSYRAPSSYLLLLNLPLLFLPLSVSPYLTKGDMSLAQKPFLPLSFHSSPPLPLLRLSIKPTKGGRRSAHSDSPFLSRSSSMAAPFLCAHISRLCVFYSLSSSFLFFLFQSLALIPSTSSH